MTYLVKRKNVYYFRIVVPIDLRIYFLRNEILKSLKTPYFDSARELVRQILHKVDRLFSGIRNVSMDKKQINTMISEFYRDCLKKGDLESLSYDEKNRWKYYDYGFTATPMMRIHTYPDGYEEMHQQIMRVLATGSFDGMKDAVKTVFNMPKDDDSYPIACMALLTVEAEIYKAKIELSKGNPQLFNELLQHYSKDQHVTEAPEAPKYESISARQKSGSISFSQAVLKYSEDKNECKDWGIKTQYENEKIFNLLLYVVEDVDMIRFDDGDFARSIRKRLLKLPKNMSKYERYNGKDIYEIMTMANVVVLSEARVNKYIEYLSALTKYAIKQKWCNVNHFEDLRINSKKVKVSEERDAYSKLDIERLLVGLQKCFKKTEPEKLWIPLLMLFLGCRPADVIKLTKDKFTVINDILAVHLKSKTEAGARTVPVHPFLLECGFDRFLSTIPESNLWSDNLKFYEQKNADTHERWYNRTFEPKFVTDEPKKSLYSIRHSFITNLKHARVDHYILKEIVGQEKDLPGGVRQIYVRHYQAAARCSQKSSQRLLKMLQRRAIILFAPLTVQCIPDCFSL